MPTLQENEALNLRAVGRIEKRAGKEVLRGYRRALAQIRKDMSKIYEKYARGGVLTHAEMTKYNRMASLQNTIIRDVGPILSRNGRVEERMAAEAYEASYFRNGWAITQEARADVNWGALSPETVRAAVQNPISGLTLHGLTLEQRRRTLLGINRSITQGLVQGDSYPQMVGRVKKFLDGDAGRAMTVVRTEGQRAYVEGQIAAADRAERLGIDIRKLWNATLDGRTRPLHGEMDGEPADENGLFHVPTIGLIRGPLMSGDPSFDINCRCRVVTEVVGYEPTKRRVGGKVVPYQTYNQWVKTQGAK